MAGPYDAQIGPLVPGQFGYIPLDVNGTPSGPATLARPAIGVKVALVFANYNTTTQDALVTGTGAPLDAALQAEPETRYNPTGL